MLTVGDADSVFHHFYFEESWGGGGFLGLQDFGGLGVLAIWALGFPSLLLRGELRGVFRSRK